jgi:hypothetical protein
MKEAVRASGRDRAPPAAAVGGREQPAETARRRPLA